MLIDLVTNTIELADGSTKKEMFSFDVDHQNLTTQIKRINEYKTLYKSLGFDEVFVSITAFSFKKEGSLVLSPNCDNIDFFKELFTQITDICGLHVGGKVAMDFIKNPAILPKTIKRLSLYAETTDVNNISLGDNFFSNLPQLKEFDISATYGKKKEVPLILEHDAFMVYWQKNNHRLTIFRFHKPKLDNSKKWGFSLAKEFIKYLPIVPPLPMANSPLFARYVKSNKVLSLECYDL